MAGIENDAQVVMLQFSDDLQRITRGIHQIRHHYVGRLDAEREIILGGVSTNPIDAVQQPLMSIFHTLAVKRVPRYDQQNLRSQDGGIIRTLAHVIEAILADKFVREAEGMRITINSRHERDCSEIIGFQKFSQSFKFW